ncbi:hypothetical protein [Rhodopseudomonas sp. B29]|uniref:hypothetical protein n=1 Tax=Rhodopseudomonas sp. B29 TaxID=95607 RepID=UPI0003467688|nr:hypothetical protein [Rhodopseudomonas sp. B29]
MTNEQDEHGARTKTGADDVKAEREASSKAVLDNMARLRALRLAREAAQPQSATKTASRTAAGKRTKTSTAKKTGKSAEDKRQALSDWLAEQQKGGFRT